MPINNITQTISTIPPAGARGVDVQTIFVTKQEDFQDHLQGTTVPELNTFKDQLNARIGEINSTATTMNEYATSASSSASTATTKAGEASSSASTATTKASEASTSRNQAETFAQQAKASAESVDVNNLVHRTGDETIAGVKTFSSSPIVPVPTTNFQPVPLRSTNITVNVGAGQTYTTINQALEYLSGFYPMYKKSGVTATINLKAGFVMAEQVLVSGIDLGWITIVGEDAETIIDHTALTAAFIGHYPAFGVEKGGTSPIIGQLFRFNVEKVGGNKHGLMTWGAGSSADILIGKGFIGAGTYGIYAANSSTINAASANCSNAGTYGIIADRASTVNAYGANCSNAGQHGIFANEGSTINATLATVQNQATGTSRVRVQAGSHIEAYGINANGGTVPVFSQAVNTLTANGIIYQ